MITVHHLSNSRSQRVLWLLEELELPYEVQRYERDAVTMLAPAALKQVHPLGKSPVITHNAVTVAESGAIIEYLLALDSSQRLLPAAGTPERLRYTYWLHYAEGSAMPPLLIKLIFDRIESSPMPWFARPIARGIAANVKSSFIGPQLKTHLNYLEAELGKHPWFAGAAFSAADIQMSFPLEVAAVRGGLGASRPRLSQFLRTIHARPAYQRALAAGGKYELLGG